MSDSKTALRNAAGQAQLFAAPPPRGTSYKTPKITSTAHATVRVWPKLSHGSFEPSLNHTSAPTHGGSETAN